MKLRNNKIKGVFVPLVTPLNSKGKLDKKSLKRLIEYLRPKIDGLVPCLSTGEGVDLSKKLWISTVKLTLSFAGDLPVIVGVEKPTTKEVIEYAKIALSMGVKTIAVLSPFGKNIEQELIYRHYAEIAETGIEILAYNKEMVCGTAISLETLIRLSEIPNIVAVKEGSRDSRITRRFMNSVQNISVMQAWDDLLTKVKTHGSIVPLANIEPGLCRNALGNQELKKEVDDAVLKYKLDEVNPLWYEDVKKELVKRRIIKSARLVKI